MNDALLLRIAQALERIAPPPAAPADLNAHPAYHWDGGQLRAVQQFTPLPVDLIIGVDRQRSAVTINSERHALGHAAHDVLLWGVRGMGKSVLVKSVTAHLQARGVGAGPDNPLGVGLIEASADHIGSLPALFAMLRPARRRFILFIDDIAFDGGDSAARMLRSMLEGGAEARPDNMRLYVTSNRRNIVSRDASENEAINARDVADDKLALADRFGLKLGFQYPDQDGYFAMVSGYARHFDLEWNAADAAAFAHARGGRSGRTAWHYTAELAGRAGRKI